MKSVGFSDPRFEKKFEVYSTDQVESRALLMPDFMQELMKFERKFGSDRIRFAFTPKSFLLGIEGQDKEIYNSINKDGVMRNATQDILDKFCMICRVVDIVSAFNRDLPKRFKT